MAESAVAFEVVGELDDEEYQALLSALRDWVSEVFDESQRRCPVRTGRLKSSGRIESNEMRSIIYDCPYAGVVEHGRGEQGEKGYFEGRRYIDGAIDELAPEFAAFLKLALHQDFNVTEA